jgi:hypothetical protein
MATAYKVAMTVRNKNGATKQYVYTASDVTTEYWLLPSGANEGQLTATGGWITDIIVTSAGDCSQNTVFINGMNSGYVVYNALNLPTALGGRQIQQNPIPIPAGAIVRVQQIT